MKRLVQLFRGGAKRPRIGRLSPHEAHQRVLAKTLALIDVRRPEEWRDSGRPAGAYGVTLQDPSFVDKVLNILSVDRTRAVAVGCKAGPRAAAASTKLGEAKFSNVSVVVGGFEAGRRDGLPVDRIDDA
ncbi:MAG: rhodanese-like domain-containing protein [Pseudomonadota bacterium]